MDIKIPICDYTKLTPTGLISSCSVSVNIENSFTFQTMRETYDDIIIDKEEWDSFIKFLKIRQKQ
jgi:hypothetical protein